MEPKAGYFAANEHGVAFGVNLGESENNRSNRGFTIKSGMEPSVAFRMGGPDDKGHLNSVRLNYFN